MYLGRPVQCTHERMDHQVRLSKKLYSITIEAGLILVKTILVLGHPGPTWIISSFHSWSPETWVVLTYPPYVSVRLVELLKQPWVQLQENLSIVVKVTSEGHLLSSM